MEKFKKNNLLLITDSLFTEPFLLPELESLQRRFAISIVTAKSKEPLLTEVNNNISLYFIDHRIQLFDFFSGLSCMFKIMFWKEVYAILKSHKSILVRILSSTKFYFSAIVFMRRLHKLNLMRNDQLIYTYWHNSKLLGTELLAKKLKLNNFAIVSRIHGYDLFNERARGCRKPFQSAMDKSLSALFFVSQKGYDYYKKTFGFLPNCEYKVVRLGVFGSDLIAPLNQEVDLSVISVSNAIKIKRVNLIIDALSLVEGQSIKWVHFGGGSCLTELEQLAQQKIGMKKNIDYTFLGNVPNNEIYNYYMTHAIDLFITTSSTEGGCPVSIQEAFSFGIPVIGTDVGGITEMIQNGVNGYLLGENPTPLEIKNSLLCMIQTKKATDIMSLKDAAFESWRKWYNAHTNSTQFVDELCRIVALRIS